MLFQQSIIGNSRIARDQWEQVKRERAAYNLNERQISAMNRAAGLHANAGLVPRDVYQEFDNVTVEQFRSDEGDTYLNDLLPLSKSVSIGKLVNRYRRVSDAGVARTSMSGQTGVLMDRTNYDYDGSIVPIHDVGFSRGWREWNAQQSENFDGLIDDQRESVRSLRNHLADQFLDGHVDNDGNTIVVDGLSWQGMKNDSRVAAINIGASGINFDFTVDTQTGDDIKAAFIQIRDTMRITNNCGRDLTVYVSREIESNFERKFSTQYDAKIIMQELADLAGIAAIKSTSKLSGNELMGFPLDSAVIRPVVGMAVNTVAMPRPVYNSDYQFVVWGAIGWEVRTDFSGQTCSFFAQDLG